MVVYVDAVGGSDADTGAVADQAWATLARVGQADLEPGSQVLLKRGCAWNEPFKLRGRAPAAKPIVLGAYGEGPRPRINGGRTHAISADEPVSGWRISGLELTSTNDLNPTHKINGGTCGIFGIVFRDACARGGRTGRDETRRSGGRGVCRRGFGGAGGRRGTARADDDDAQEARRDDRLHARAAGGQL